MSEKDLRNANIGILVGTLIAVGGAVVFRHSGEATLQLVGLLAFVGAFAVHTVLDELTNREKRKPRQ